MLFLAFLDDFFDFPLLADACSAPTFGGIKDGLFNSKESLLTGDARRAASAPFGADLARDRPPDPSDAPDPPAAGAAPGAGPPAGPAAAPTTPAHEAEAGPTVSPALFSAGSSEARTVIPLCRGVLLFRRLSVPTSPPIQHAGERRGSNDEPSKETDPGSRTSGQKAEDAEPLTFSVVSAQSDVS